MKGCCKLAMHLADALGNQPNQFVRVDFHAAVGRGAHLVGNLLPKAFDFAGVPVKQQRAHR